MSNAVIGLYRNEEGVSRLVDKIDLSESLESLLKRKKWKEVVRAAVEQKGYGMLTINVVHSGADLDVNLIATVEKPVARFGTQRKKAVLRGGRPITGPVKTGKTMAAKRRSR